VFVAQKRKDTMRQELAVQDLVFLTPRAGRRILAFLAEFGTMGDDAVFAAGPSHPLLMMLGLQKYKLEFNYYWMLRVLDAAKALEGRGYPAGVRAEVHLEVEDEVLPANSGRWLLKVEDGRGRVARGGFGRVRTSARGLAAMYTGHMAPAALAMAGMAMGEESALREAGLVFGAMPWMTDFF
jgi:predicted acetyltransferase